MMQQHIVPLADAEAMFPNNSGCSWCMGRTLLSHDCSNYDPLPPTITNLAGPIVCETCGGEGATWHGAPKPFGLAFYCPDCDGLGYPPELEIVSVNGDEGSTRWHTVHGVVKLGPPEDPYASMNVRYPITVVET
jgi:hypothetical protein